MDKTSMFGKTYNTVGSPDSNFLIKTKGDLKVLWGGKYIDIIKNGKIASSNDFAVKTVESSDNISGNGIYLIPTDNQIWVSIDGTTLQINQLQSDSIFDENFELKTIDLKSIALKNIGLNYNTLEEAKDVKSGIIYAENKLYTVNNGQFQELFIMPKGSIIMYDGKNPIPEGWAICDGENGTPDLHDKFIKASTTTGDDTSLNISNDINDPISISIYKLIFIMKV